MLAAANRILAKLAPAGVAALAFGTLAVVGALDYLTGYQLSFSVFYLVPVGFAAWYAGRLPGLGFALLSSVVWYGVDSSGGYPYDHPAIPIWNAFVRLSFFLIIALLLCALRDRLAAERRLAKTDALTGVLNSRAFTEQLERELAIAGRAGRPLTLAYLDLDDFKRINDTYGHGEGDRLLRVIAQKLIEGTRRTDTVARLGGDEFALILPGTDLDGAETLLAKLRQLLKESLARDARSVTCSIGAVVFREAPHSADDATTAADRLMYDAKTAGKSTVVLQVYSGPTRASLQAAPAAAAPRAARG